MHLFKLSALRLAALLAAPMIAFPAAVTLRIGPTTTCEYGTCSSVDTLADGQSTSGLLNLSFTVNGDSYQLLSPFNAVNSDPNGTTFNTAPVAIYTGSKVTSLPDVFTVNFFENYTYNGTLNGFYYDEATDAQIKDAAPGSYLTAQAYYGGQGLGVMGPFGPGDGSGAKESQLFGLTGDPLTFQYQFVFDFAAGTTPGSLISAPASVPEPASGAFALVGVGLLFFSRIKRWRKAV